MAITLLKTMRDLLLVKYCTLSSIPFYSNEYKITHTCTHEVRASPLAQSWEKVGFSNTSVENKFVLPTFQTGTLAFFRAKDETDVSTCHYIALHLIKCCHQNCTHMHTPTQSHIHTHTPTHTHEPLTHHSILFFSSSSWEWHQNNESYSISGDRSEVTFCTCSSAQREWPVWDLSYK